jgi:uncharacterized protein YqeY
MFSFNFITMNLEQKVNEDIKQAMLAKEKEKLNALRAIKSALLLLKTEKGANDEISDEAGLKVLQKLAKQRKDAAELYLTQNRQDLYQEEIEQLAVIQQYLPEMLSDEDLTTILKQFIADNKLAGAKDLGKLMGLATKTLAGKADNKKISEIAKNLLT